MITSVRYRLVASVDAGNVRLSTSCPTTLNPRARSVMKVLSSGSANRLAVPVTVNRTGCTTRSRARVIVEPATTPSTEMPSDTEFTVSAIITTADVVGSGSTKVAV